MKTDIVRSRQKMPTAAKLMAAIVLGLGGYAMADVLIHRVEALGTAEVNHIFFATVGFCLGWSKIGPMAEEGYLSAWTAGIAAAITSAMAIIMIGAAHHIYRGMLYHAYKDVDTMLTGFMRKALENFSHFVDPYVICATIAAGLLAGVFSGFAARLWR